MHSNVSDHAKLWELNPDWDLLTTGEKMYIEKESEMVSYRKNEIIYSEGETPDYVMMLVTGKVRIYKEGVGLKPQIIRMLKPCDIFGYRSVIADDTHSSNANAFEPCLICKINKEAFMQVIQQNNRFCFRMMEEMARDLAKSQSQTINLTQKHIRGRLAESLLMLKQQYGVEEDDSTIAMYMSREDLANLSSMTTANAIRTLSQFAQEELISMDGRKIKLLDEKELMRISRMG